MNNKEEQIACTDPQADIEAAVVMETKENPLEVVKPPHTRTKPESQPAAGPHIDLRTATCRRNCLSGGVIIDDNEEMLGLINESTIRKFELRHSDRLLVKPAANGRYVITEILKRSGESNPTRVESPYCFVSKRQEQNRSIYVIESYLHGGVRKPLQLPGAYGLIVEIQPQDLEFFDLMEDDSVDIAYWIHRSETMRVIWKYR